MSLLRFAGVVFSLFCTASLIAQETAEISERAANWAAPPYWAPQGPSKDVEQILQGDGEPGIQPMGALPSPPLPFTAINPCRIVDTRGAVSPFGGPALVPNASRAFILPAGPCAGLPSDAGAWSLNFTVIGGPGTFQGGFLTAWSTGSSQPLVSTLNFNANQLVANAAVVPAGTSGAIDVFVNAPAHLLIDVNGYYKGLAIVNTVNSLSGAVTLAAGSNVSITPSGQTLTIANTAPAAWRLTGNSGTTAGTNFLGTTDDEPLDLKVNGDRGLRIEPLIATGIWGPNLIGGFVGNFVTGGKVGATIGGGGQTGAAFVNRVLEDFGTVGGGWGNTAQGYAAVVDGGRGNSAGNHASVGGGQENVATGNFATLPGGFGNAAAGNYSFAGGRRAKANDHGAFVWGDSTDEDVSSSGANSFVVRATGGFEFLLGSGVLCELHDASGWSCGSPSDRALKRDLSPVDARETLERLVAMPIQTWSYIAHEPAARHMGPMAQDFAAAYGLGSDDKRINPLDANGVALAAIQGLYAEVQELRKRLAALEAEKD